MASGTRGRPRRVQRRVSEPTSSTPSRSPSSFGGSDKLAGAQAPPPGPSNVPAVSPGPPNVPIAASIGPKAPPRVYSDEKVQDIIRIAMGAKILAIEGFQERPHKARLPDVYRGDNHMACYNFCQQCKDHFATIRAKGPNRIPFAASFFCNRISFRWQQHKRKLDNEILVLPTWKEFKAFLWKSLGDSRIFVDSFWHRIKRDAKYQEEDVIGWAAHLEHLQTVLKEFNSTAAPNEEVLIRCFREGLRPSIQAQIDSQHQESDFWDKVLNKAIEAESKAAF